MELKAKDLRIGNLVGKYIKDCDTYYYAICTVDLINLDSFVSFDELDNYKNSEYVKYDPIPLTEEWFLDFGFEEEEDYFVYVLSYDFGEIKIYRQGGYFFIEGVIKQEVKYVHQLQNLYHALTGNELEIIK
jgi:hypothetical protein